MAESGFDQEVSSGCLAGCVRNGNVHKLYLAGLRCGCCVGIDFYEFPYNSDKTPTTHFQLPHNPHAVPSCLPPMQVP